MKVYTVHELANAYEDYHDRNVVFAIEADAEIQQVKADWFERCKKFRKQDADEHEAEIAALRERMGAIENAGHSEDCGGMDTANQRCDCGWLQREGAHKYILRPEERQRVLVEALEELDGLFSFDTNVSEGEFDFSKPERIDYVFKQARAALAAKEG